MSSPWYIFKDQQQSGPFLVEQLIALIKDGKVGSGDLFWSEGMTDWLKGSGLPDLFPQTVTPPPPPGQVVPPPLVHQETVGSIPPPPSLGKPLNTPPPITKQATEMPASGQNVPRPVEKIKRKKSGVKLAAIIGGSLLGLLILFIILVFSIARSALRSSDIYALSLQTLESNQEAVLALGEPVEAGKGVSGEITSSDSSSEAVLSIPVSGSLSEGQLEVDAYKSGEQWQYNILQLVMANGETINLLSDSFNLGFDMIYPDHWEYEIIDGNTAYYEEPVSGDLPPKSISVTVLFSTAAGGPYADLNAVYREIESVYSNIGAEQLFTDEGVDTTKQLGSDDYPYKILMVSYPGNDYTFSEIAVLLQRDNNLFYQIVFTSIAEQEVEMKVIFETAINSFLFTSY